MVRSSDHVVERLTTALPVFDEYGSLVSPLGTVRAQSTRSESHTVRRRPVPLPGVPREYHTVRRRLVPLPGVPREYHTVRRRLVPLEYPVSTIPVGGG